MYLNHPSFIRQTIILWALMLLVTPLSAQLPHTVLAELLPEPDSTDLHVVVEATGFFRNTEYAGRLVDGETWPGMRLRAGLQKQIAARVFISAGAQVQRLAGDTQKLMWWPLLRFDYRLAPGWQLVLGTLYGHCRHDLPEPAFSSERFLTRPVEEGAQLFFKRNRFEAEAFIDWQRYIMQGDTAQERFLTSVVGKWQSDHIRLAAHTLFHHIGGQINTTDAKVSSVINNGVEVAYKQPLTHRLTIEGQLWLLNHSNMTPAVPLLFNSGRAVMPRLRLASDRLQVDLGYWYAKNYIAPAGEAIFSQISTRIPGYTLNQRQMIFAKLNYTRQIHPALHLLAAFEQYFDTRRIRYDYAFAVYLIYRNL